MGTGTRPAVERETPDRPRAAVEASHLRTLQRILQGMGKEVAEKTVVTKLRAMLLLVRTIIVPANESGKIHRISINSRNFRRGLK